MRSLHKCELQLALCIGFLWLCAQAACALPSEIRVRLFEAHPLLSEMEIRAPFSLCNETETMYSSGLYRLRASGPNSMELVSGRERIRLAHNCSLHGSASAPLVVRVANHVHRYKGKCNVYVERQSGRSLLRVVNIVPTRDYVYSAVGSEIQPGWPPEALKAQAVLVQTLLERYRASQPIGDSTQQQAYLGNDYARRDVCEAVDQVWEQMLTFNGHPAQIFYSSTCAGGTSKGTDVFGSAATGLTYLKSVKCDYCRESPFWKPTITHIQASRFATIFGAALPHVESSDEVGRPLSISYSGKDGRTREMSGYQFWILLGQKFGWDKAPGLRFSLSQTDGRIALTSTGAGHGVGLCEWGAASLARAGKSYRDILQYYFPGTTVQRASQSNSRESP
jgi:stage II sporulation protein D